MMDSSSSRLPPVIVLGSGMAGLTAALALAPVPVILLTKTDAVESGSTTWAQGGIAAALGPGDSPALHAADTVAAGAGLTDPIIAELLTKDGASVLADLIAQGAPFDKNPDGTPRLGREAAHSLPRVAHAGGDSTGRVIGDWLASLATHAPNITVRTACFAQDLIVEDGRVCGVRVFDDAHGWQSVAARAVVLATGGWGLAWPGTTNPSENTGDGVAMAARAGATLADMEFMQFHPTALDAPTDGGARLPLLTEALRGAGAILLDASGRRFMPDEHPMAELAPRDVVARAVGKRIAAGERVFLDLRPALIAKGEGAFPQVLAACREAGFDPLTAPVPITPAAHYAMGGVVVDPRGRTSLPGLWAVGEVSCTGVHGANRLASNSLLEGLVFGRRAAVDIQRTATGTYPISVETRETETQEGFPPRAVAEALRGTLRALMGRTVGLVRDGQTLAETATTLAALSERYEAAACVGTECRIPQTREEVRFCGETRNLLLVARLVVAAALRRRESRGAHWRADYPNPDPTQARRLTQCLTQRGDEVALASGAVSNSECERVYSVS